MIYVRGYVHGTRQEVAPWKERELWVTAVALFLQRPVRGRQPFSLLPFNSVVSEFSTKCLLTMFIKTIEMYREIWNESCQHACIKWVDWIIQVVEGKGCIFQPKSNPLPCETHALSPSFVQGTKGLRRHRGMTAMEAFPEEEVIPSPGTAPAQCPSAESTPWTQEKKIT